jgi:TRAP transporter TAXI family solute receptor
MLLTKNRRRVAAAATAAFTVLALSACGSGDEDTADAAGAGDGGTSGCEWDEANLAIGGGATGGSYYLLGATLESLIDSEVDCAEATTAAGTLNEFARAQKDLYFTQPDAAYAAWSGEGGQGFDEGEQYDDTRILAVGYPNIFTMIVNADHPATSVADLTEDDVVGTSAGTTTDVLEKLFELHGVNPQLTVITSFDQLMTALRQGQITAINYGTAHPGPALVEAQESQDLKFLNYETDALEGLQEDYPDYEIVDVPDGTYEFMEGDYEGWARRTTLVGKASIDEELAAEITRLFYEETDQFVSAVPVAADFNIETLQTALDAGTLRLPFHPGSRAYFQEQGVEFPDSVPEG